MRPALQKFPADFGHPPRVLAFWRRLVRAALATRTDTPFFLCSAEPIAEALVELQELAGAAQPPIRHWLSCKTQPLAPLLRWWRRQGRPIEVVSEFEYRAARHEGFVTENILINGPAKHRWLPRVAAPGLRVNFDSLRELKELLPLAKQLQWHVGLRLRTSLEHDPEHPEFPTQFGFEAAEAMAALKALRRADLKVEALHFHLRTNVPGAAVYEEAIAEAHSFCVAANWWPAFLDCGGGLPPRHTFSPGGKAFAAEFSLPALRKVFRRWLPRFQGLRELWLENGRFVSARSGVLVVTVLDVKERAGLRQLICDGGRTLNALVSNWEEHGLISLPPRSGPQVLTAVHGPTCMAFDQLTRRPLARSLRPGDRLIWLEAGAYHLPWETQFSHGRAAVFWHEGDNLSVARSAGEFADWWGRGR
ncbi:MAG: hypothetical protein EBS84_09125 [Proteobacteria bacterium]|nr:hypothetical protein [Verrucomicrobiota bacterium]NBU09162.1 hypothetical protein [Pseudomonadota bacterium]